MDRNIAAFIRQDTISIVVSSAQNTAQISAIASVGQGLKVSDLVVLHVNGQYRVFDVVEVHDDLRIPTNHEYTVPWVVQKVDLNEYNRIQEENSRLCDKLTAAYRSNVRKQARSVVLGELGLSADADVVTALLTDK